MVWNAAPAEVPHGTFAAAIESLRPQLVEGGTDGHPIAGLAAPHVLLHLGEDGIGHGTSMSSDDIMQRVLIGILRPEMRHDLSGQPIEDCGVGIVVDLWFIHQTGDKVILKPLHALRPGIARGWPETRPQSTMVRGPNMSGRHRSMT